MSEKSFTVVSLISKIASPDFNPASIAGWFLITEFTIGGDTYRPLKTYILVIKIKPNTKFAKGPDKTIRILETNLAFKKVSLTETDELS